KQTRYPFGRHVRAADARKMHLPVCALLDCRDQGCAEPVARFLACNQKNVRAHLSGPDDTPRTKISARSAALTNCSASATMVLPATTAMPARPAAIAPSTVLGPIDGKSNRRSCAGLGALTKVGGRGAAGTRPFVRISATRASIASVPSAASTANT